MSYATADPGGIFSVGAPPPFSDVLHIIIFAMHYMGRFLDLPLVICFIEFKIICSLPEMIP